MKPLLLSIMRCPDDGGRLKLVRQPDAEGRPNESEALRCEVCRCEYPVVRGIPRFVESDGYVNSFSYEWERHPRTQLDIDRRFSEETFRTRAGFTPGEIDGKVVLDAGCGMGRYMEWALAQGAEVVGADMSLSVEQASANLDASPKAHFVQADITRLPFAESTFDHIFSLGVLHHAPDPSAAFAALVPHLKSGGSIAISVYLRGAGLYENAKRWRRFTTRMDRRRLYRLCSLASLVLYPIYRLPVLASFYHYLPVSMHRSFEWRRLDTFDAYSPAYASTHTYHEVYSWLRRAGLVDIEVLPATLSMRGWKP